MSKEKTANHISITSLNESDHEYEISENMAFKKSTIDVVFDGEGGIPFRSKYNYNYGNFHETNDLSRNGSLSRSQ